MGGSGSVAGDWSGDVTVDNNGNIHDDGGEDGAGVTPEGTMEGASTTVCGDVDVIRRFLREVGGVLESIVEAGTWAGLVGYVQGRFA